MPSLHTLRVTFHIEERGYAFSDNGPPELYFGLEIDGAAPVRFTTVVAPRALADSITADGEHFIFTCACGHPEDAGITSGVHVTHTATTVRWRAALPALAVSFGGAAYATAITTGMAQAEDLVRVRPELEGWMPPRLQGSMQIQATWCASDDEAAALFTRAFEAGSAEAGFVVQAQLAVTGVGDAALHRRAIASDPSMLLSELHTIVAREGTLVVRLQAHDRPGISRLSNLPHTAAYQLQVVRWAFERGQVLRDPIVLA